MLKVTRRFIAPLCALSWLMTLKCSAHAEVLAPSSNAPASPAHPSRAVSLTSWQHLPSALEVGEASGVALKASQQLHQGRAEGASLWAVELLGAWSGVSTSQLSWATSHQEGRLHVRGAVERALGVGALSLSAGGGGLWLSELRERHQAARLGLTGSARQRRADRLELELSASLSLRLRLIGELALLMSLDALYRPLTSLEGPSLTLAQGVGLCWRF